VAAGESSESLRKGVRALINQASWLLHDYFPLDFPFPESAGRRAIRCTACTYRVDVDGRSACLDRACMNFKTTWYAETRTHAASHETGIPVIYPPDYEKLQRSSHFSPIHTGHEQLTRALDTGCPHLHLAPASTYQCDGYAHPEGYPEVVYICTTKTCMFGAATDARAAREQERVIALGRVQDRLNGKIRAALVEGRAWGALAAAFGANGKTPEQHVLKLAAKIYASILDVSADPDMAAEQVDYWLAAHVTGHQPDHDLWDSLRRRWQSIARRIGDLHQYCPSYVDSYTLRHDIANLRRALDDAPACSDRQELSTYLPAAANLLTALESLYLRDTDFAPIPDLVAGDDAALTGALTIATAKTLTYALTLVHYRGDQPRAEKIHAQIECLRANQNTEA